MRPDNSHHLLTSARERSEKARARATEALNELSRTGGPGTVSGLARLARVSRSWLYTQPDLIARLQGDLSNGRPPSNGSSIRASEPSLRRRLELAHQRIRQLTEENNRLREKLARAHGALRAANITGGNAGALDGKDSQP